MRRRSFLATSVAAGLSFLGGCLGGSSALDEWNFEDREAEAWEQYDQGYAVANAIDDHDESSLEEAFDDLDAARDAYDELRDEARDRSDEDFELYMDLNDYFSALHGSSTAARNAVGLHLDRDVPGGDDPEPFLVSMRDHRSTAAGLYDDLDELQDAIDGDRFE